MERKEAIMVINMVVLVGSRAGGNKLNLERIRSVTL
jgi:hypothetical protein